MNDREEQWHSERVFHRAVDWVVELLADPKTREETERDLANTTARFGPVEWNFIEEMEESIGASPAVFAEQIIYFVSLPTLHPLLRAVIASCVARPSLAEKLQDEDCRKITRAFAAVVRDGTADDRVIVAMLANLFALSVKQVWDAANQREVLEAVRLSSRHPNELVRRWSYDVAQLLTRVRGAVGEQAVALLRTSAEDPSPQLARRWADRL